jgi:hypothetical protein
LFGRIQTFFDIVTLEDIIKYQHNSNSLISKVRCPLLLRHTFVPLLGGLLVKVLFIPPHILHIKTFG